MRLSPLDHMPILCSPFAPPIAFWTHQRPGQRPYPRTDAPWRTMGWTTSAALPSIHRPEACAYEAIDHTQLWLRFSVHAGMTAALRCTLPPAVAHQAYVRAAERGKGVFGCAGAALGAYALGNFVSMMGIGINVLQVTLGLAVAVLCVGLSAYYFAQAALEAWRPPFSETHPASVPLLRRRP